MRRKYKSTNSVSNGLVGIRLEGLKYEDSDRSTEGIGKEDRLLSPVCGERARSPPSFGLTVFSMGWLTWILLFSGDLIVRLQGTESSLQS
jgi:hypothetical protein